jgi:DNA-binding transcriptional ArsR family regulator
MQRPARRARPDSANDSVWKALANPLRRAMLDHLARGAMTTGELADQFAELSRFAVMQHLRVLTDAGLVHVQRAGRQRFNYLNPVPIQMLYDRWVGRYMQPWTEALVSLRDELEGEPRTTRKSRS